MICAKSGENWPSGFGEVENVKFTNDQKSSLELSAQVS
jgi:hypothetical protein